MPHVPTVASGHRSGLGPGRRTAGGLAVAVLTLAVAACGAGTPAPPPAPRATPAPAKPPTKAQLIARAQAAVGRLTGRTAFGGTQSGTLFVINADKGLALTNYHVIEGASALRADFGDKGRSSVVVEGSNGCLDLALLRVTNLPDGVGVLPLADSDKVKTGDEVLAAGFPATSLQHGGNATFTSGTITAVDVKDAYLGRAIARAPSLLQTDTAINRGNSGGPLLTPAGQVAGINTYGADGEGTNYAIAANIVRKALPALLAGDNGFGLLTVPARDVDVGPLVTAKYDNARWGRYVQSWIRRAGGMLVLGTVAGSPADKAGFELGDWIAEMNGVEINSATKACDVYEGLGAGDTLKVEGRYLTPKSYWNSLTKTFTRRMRHPGRAS